MTYFNVGLSHCLQMNYTGAGSERHGLQLLFKDSICWMMLAGLSIDLPDHRNNIAAAEETCQSGHTVALSFLTGKQQNQIILNIIQHGF